MFASSFTWRGERAQRSASEFYFQGDMVELFNYSANEHGVVCQTA
jgi:hypothetical protein